MACRWFAPDRWLDRSCSLRPQRLSETVFPPYPKACDDDEEEDDWDGSESDWATRPTEDPFEMDDEKEPEPEYGDFWAEPDEFDDCLTPHTRIG
jgi:hypothetical protein